MSSFLSTLLLFCVVQSDPFMLSSSSLPVPSDCLPASDAFFKAKQLRQTVGAMPPRGTPLVQLERSRLRGLRWCFYFETSTMHVNPRTGKLVYYANDDWLERRKTPRAAFESIFISDQQLIDRAKLITLQLGFPSTAQVSFVRRGVLDPENWGTASVQYRPYIRGRRVLGCGGGISFDEKDGVIVSVDNDLDYVVETHEPAISEMQARNRAKAAYEQHISSEDRWPMDNDPLALFYVPREKNFGSQRPLQEYPETKVRIAYVVPFGDDAVWIDAVNGQVLGGTKGKRPPRP